MKEILYKTEIVAAVETGRSFQVWALIDSFFESSNSRLIVKLDAFVREINLRGYDHDIRPEWLPKSQTISEYLSPEEASNEARSIFSSWTKKIRECLPATSMFEDSLGENLNLLHKE